VLSRYDAAFVDPGTGPITGVGPSSPWIILLLVNIHDCGRSCEGYPGYQAWLATPLPTLDDHITVGGLILGVLGVLLLFLVVSGAVIWWPGAECSRWGRAPRESGEPCC
jgi:hypothetical protein